MKILLAQLNSIVGDIEYNKSKIIKNIKFAKENGVDLIIFPKFSLTGILNNDLLSRYPYIINQSYSAIKEIEKYCDNCAVLMDDNNLIFINNKKTEKIDNYFEFNGLKFNIAKDENCDFIISNEPLVSRYGFEKLNHDKMSNLAKKYNVKYIFVNQIGYNDGYVYDGLSRIYNKEGEIIALAKAFEEDLLIYDTNSENKINQSYKLNLDYKKEFNLNYEDDLNRTYKTIILAIKDYFSKNKLKRAVLGLSGGLDSSVCAVLLADALGNENVLGVSMPSKITSDESKNDAKELAQNLKINYIEVPIKTMQDCFKNSFDEVFDRIKFEKCTQSYTQDNIQARSRATVLWGIANEFSSCIPIATSDKSESYMGYATINGDMSGGFAPIADVTKTKLFALAKWMNKNRKEKNAIPENIIKKPPGAELAIDTKTNKPLLAESALMPYEFLDEVIWRIENLHQTMNDMININFIYEKNNKITQEEKLKWLEKFFKRMNNALFKWSIMPPAVIIDTHSIIGCDFRQPITSNINYKENK